MEAFNNCTWHPIAKWILFIPLGILATGIIQGLLRWANSETPFIAELLAHAAEPWAFFYTSLWILPRFHRIFIGISLLIYIAIYLTTFYLTIVRDNFSAQPWADYSISVVAIVSSSIAAYYFFRQTYSIGGSAN